MEKKHNNIIWTKDGDIGILQLDNPPENYLTHPEFIEIDVLKEYMDDDIKGLVITGTGRHFSAGADSNMIFKQIRKRKEFVESLIKGNRLLNYIQNLEIPVVAAVQGVCFGGGLEVAMSCHIRVCTEQTLFAFPEVNLELIPGMGGSGKLADIIGKAEAIEILLNGDTINGSEALNLKLADHLTERKDTLSYSIELLKKVTANRSVKIINMIMRSINNAEKMEFEEATKRDVEMFCELASEAANKRNLK